MAKNLFRNLGLGIATALLAGSTLCAQTPAGYVPTPENLKARTEFQDNKFGVFLHWGLYSMIAQGEWFMNVPGVTWQEYEKMASAFYPHQFNAAEWVSAIKASGAKYICITTRHHDGFSMFDTKYSDFNIVDATPFKRDVMKELAAECHKQGIKLHFYYSHLDWRREDYPLGRTGHDKGRDPKKQNWDTYYAFMNNQLTELLTNYGEIGAIWFDGVWDQDQNPDFDWHLPEQYAMIHKLQPACLIGNNHHMVPFEGEDIQIFERDLPGENTAGLSGQAIGQLPLETCETMNGMWGYKLRDQEYKSPKTLIQYLVRAAGKNANLLLNMGPQPNGELPATGVERLKAMGEWMKVYGETIYGTRAGEVSPREWGVSTRKGDRLFIHILDLKDDGLYLPVTSRVVKAVKFADKTPIKFRQSRQGVFIELPEVPTDTDYVVELTIKD